MNMSISERRQIENEMIFRRSNEKVVAVIEELDSMHVEQGNPDLVTEDDLALHFNCECSDENCTERIILALDEYQQIHADRKSFIVKPGHEVTAIEEVVRTENNFSVVRKLAVVANPGTELNETSVDNS